MSLCIAWKFSHGANTKVCYAGFDQSSAVLAHLFGRSIQVPKLGLQSGFNLVPFAAYTHF